MLLVFSWGGSREDREGGEGKAESWKFEKHPTGNITNEPGRRPALRGGFNIQRLEAKTGGQRLVKF